MWSDTSSWELLVVWVIGQHLEEVTWETSKPGEEYRMGYLGMGPGCENISDSWKFSPEGSP